MTDCRTDQEELSTIGEIVGGLKGVRNPRREIPEVAFGLIRRMSDGTDTRVHRRRSTNHSRKEVLAISVYSGDLDGSLQSRENS